MAKFPEPGCLLCGRLKVDEPDQFYVRTNRRTKSGKVGVSSYCKPCTRKSNSDRYRNETRPCSVHGCKGKLASNGLCPMHRSRIRAHGEVGEATPRRAPKGAGSTDKNGYRRTQRRRPDQSVMIHRHVMEEMIGRPLRHDERVHHKNGFRSDNRSTNLELWSISQPAGQRVEDKIEWAKEFLAMYLSPEDLHLWVKSVDDDDHRDPA